MNTKDYIKEIIEKGDSESSELAVAVAPSLQNNSYVDAVEDGMNGLAGLRIPKGFEVVINAGGGNPGEKNVEDYVVSAVKDRVNDAVTVGATPLGFADVIDAGEHFELKPVTTALNSVAKDENLAILNGELAKLGPRVRTPFNMNITMISIIKKGVLPNKRVFSDDGHEFIRFDPEEKLVWINSDGQGTKGEFYERNRDFHLGLEDSLAMKLDDLIKKGAIPKAVFDIVEMNGLSWFSKRKLSLHANVLSKQIGVPLKIVMENVGNRIASYKKGVPAYNVSGSSVSVIDEKRLKNPLMSRAGEYLLAFRLLANPRSNGISAKRAAMTAMFGPEWHKIKEGKQFMEYLSTPSTILYPYFKALIEEGIASNVYHMSGGAFNGKLARPLAKQGLFVSADNLLKPDYRELALAGFGLSDARCAYGTYPMGNDAFISTSNPHKAMKRLNQMGLESTIVAQLKRATKDKSGVELKTHNGEMVYFSGRE